MTGEKHDFSLFEPATERKKSEKVIDASKHLDTQKSKAQVQKSKRSLISVFIGVLFAAFFALMLFNKSQMSEISDKINKEQQLLMELEAEHTRLQMELEGQMSIRNVEEYARDVLGMQKVDPAQVERIAGEKTDRAEVSEIKGKSLRDLFE